MFQSIALLNRYDAPETTPRLFCFIGIHRTCWNMECGRSNRRIIKYNTTCVGDIFGIAIDICQASATREGSFADARHTTANGDGGQGRAVLEGPPMLVSIITKCSFVTYSFKYIQYIYNIRDMKYGYNSSGSYNLTTAAPSELVVK